jgi:hypothetical protein
LSDDRTTETTPGRLAASDRVKPANQQSGRGTTRRLKSTAKSAAPPRNRPMLRIWGWPLTLAVLTFCGLLSALLGETGFWWGLSWAALSLPLVVIAVCLARAFPGHRRMRR